MDIELAKASLPIVGGLLAFAGGIFTFVNARLKEAENADARDRILGVTVIWIAMGLWVLGSILVAIPALRLIAIPCFGISFALFYRLFLSGPQAISRREVAFFSVLSAVTAVAILSAISLFVLEALAELQVRTTEVQVKMVELMGRMTRSME